MTDQPQAAANDCEHHYGYRILGGHPLYVPLCTLCHTPGWNDLKRQADELRKPLENRLRLAHQARRAKEHQLDDIRRALCDVGVIEDDDPYSHADLADVIRQSLGDSPTAQYPHPDGNVTVLGPEIFASGDGQTICWRGVNYVPQPEPPAAPDPAPGTCTATGEGLLHDRVRALHANDGGYCAHCMSLGEDYVPWPCPTVRALDGDATLTSEGPGS